MHGDIDSFLQAGFDSLSRNELVDALASFASARDLLCSEADQALLEPIERDARLAIVCTYLGHAYALSDDPRAQDTLHQAIEIAGRSHNLFAPVELQARLFIAEHYTDKGLYARALTQFDIAYNLAAFLHDKTAMELSAGHLGSICLYTSRLEQACDWFLVALELAGDDGANKKVWLGSLGLSFSELGQYDRAIDYYQSAFAVAQESGDRETMSICLGAQGNARFEQERYDEAQMLYEQAQDVATACGDRRRLNVWLGNQGIALLRQNQPQEASKKIEQAIAIARQDSDLRSLAAHLDSLSECKIAKGEMQGAFAAELEALDLSRQVFDRLGERMYLTNLGKIKARGGELNPAFVFFKEAVDLFDEQRATIKADDLKTTFANRGQDLYREIIDVCFRMGRRVEALEYVGRAKSRALIDLLANSPVDISELDIESDSSIAALKSREADLRAQIAALERLLVEDEGSLSRETDNKNSDDKDGLRRAQPSQTDTRKLYGEWREVVNQLKRRHPDYASLIATSTLTYDDMRKLWLDKMLEDGTCVVEFYYASDYLLVSLITKDNELITHHIDDAGTLEDLQNDLFSFFEMSSTEGWEVPVSLSKRLYKTLFGDLFASLPDGGNSIDRLIVVPHGNLYHFPFAALHDGHGYLCQSKAVSYLPAISLIPILKAAGGASGASKYLVSAISDYSATRKNGMVFSSTLRSSAGLEDLTYTMEEAQSIKTLSDAVLLTNEEVKEALPEIFGQYEVVHFAGHAIFNNEEPMASGLVLNDGSILSAAAILEGSALRTRMGKLLVLSACQTGVNAVTQGGEILGLARALMYAGMPNLVLSLWEVADRSTASLMEDFHALWQGGKISVAQALRQAQMHAIDKKQPVHAWAPFIHFGID